MTQTARLELETRWKEILEYFTGSGCGIGKYCEDRKISKASLYSWSQRLGIPIKNRGSLTKTHLTDKNDKQASSLEKETPFSFIELNVPCSKASAPFPLKLELLLTKERKLKIETTSTWEGVTSMIKTLVS